MRDAGVCRYVWYVCGLTKIYFFYYRLVISWSNVFRMWVNSWSIDISTQCDFSAMICEYDSRITPLSMLGSWRSLGNAGSRWTSEPLQGRFHEASDWWSKSVISEFDKCISPFFCLVYFFEIRMTVEWQIKGNIDIYITMLLRPRRASQVIYGSLRPFMKDWPSRQVRPLWNLYVLCCISEPSWTSVWRSTW